LLICSLKAPGQQPGAAVVYFLGISLLRRDFRLGDVLLSPCCASGLCITPLPLVSTLEVVGDLYGARYFASDAEITHARSTALPTT
jgi:hypothetical protein